MTPAALGSVARLPGIYPDAKARDILRKPADDPGIMKFFTGDGYRTALTDG